MKDFDSLVEKLRGIFVTKERYELEIPQLKSIIYGGIGLIVIAFFSAVISLVIRTK